MLCSLSPYCATSRCCLPSLDDMELIQCPMTDHYGLHNVRPAGGGMEVSHWRTELPCPLPAARNSALRCGCNQQLALCSAGHGALRFRMQWRNIRQHTVILPTNSRFFVLQKPTPHPPKMEAHSSIVGGLRTPEKSLTGSRIF